MYEKNYKSEQTTMTNVNMGVLEDWISSSNFG